MEDQVTQVSISPQTEPVLDQAGLTQTHENSNNKDPVLNSEQGLKKKRGRPSLKTSTPSSQSSVKRSRGRPHGSGNLQMLASLGGRMAETAGGSFTPHVVTVNPGEDMVNTISTFSRTCPRAICILSATGAVSSVLIQKPGSLSDTLRCEGNFEILSLSGSYTFGGDNAHCKEGTLTILLAEPDGRVFGGVLVGSLIAAAPIQLIMASFKQNICKEIMRRNSARSSSTAPNMSSNPDSEKVSLNVPRMIEGKRICLSPTSGLLPTTNRLPVNVIPATTTGMSDIVNIPANQKMHSVSVNGVGMDCKARQPIIDQRISTDDNASVNFSSGQL